MLKVLQVIVSLLFLCLLLYFNTLHSPFTFDDSPFILKDSHIHIQELTIASLAEAAIQGKPPDRPLSNITFALNYYFGQDNPVGYHLVNIVIHFLAGVFLYFLMLYSLELSGATKRQRDLPSLTVGNIENQIRWLAFAGACIWLANPLHTQSVTYVCQRMTSMAAMFYVVSLVFYIRGRMTMFSIRLSRIKPWLWFLASSIAGICAIATKPNAGTLPLMVVAYEWFFFRKFSKISMRRQALWAMGALIVFTALAILYLGYDPVDRILSGYQSREFTLSQRVMTQFRLVIYYISLIFFPRPDRLNLDYNYPLSYSLLAPPTTLIAVAAIAYLVFITAFSTRKDPLLSFGIFWFLSNLVIESSVIGIEMVFEHRTYLPSMFIIPVIAIKTIRLIRFKHLQIGSCCVLITVLAVWTHGRNHVWADEVRLWEDCVRKSPGKARPHYNLGCILIKRHLYDETIAQFTKASQINPDFGDTYYNLGYAMAQKKMYHEAIGQFQKALSLDPDNADAHNNLANALSRIGRSDEAIAHYLMAVQLKPDVFDFQVNLAMESFSAGNYQESILHYQKALAISPEDVSVLNKLGYVYFSTDNIDEAISYYLKALRLKPDNPESIGKMGDALLQKGNPKTAISYYMKTLDINPDDAQSNYNLGIAYYQMGNHEQAMIYFNRASRLNPSLRPPAAVGSNSEQPSSR